MRRWSGLNRQQRKSSFRLGKWSHDQRVHGTSPWVLSVAFGFYREEPVGSQHPFRLGMFVPDSLINSRVDLITALFARLQHDIRLLRLPLPPEPSPFLTVGIPVVWDSWGLPSCSERTMAMGVAGISNPASVWMSLLVTPPSKPLVFLLVGVTASFTCLIYGP